MWSTGYFYAIEKGIGIKVCQKSVVDFFVWVSVGSLKWLGNMVRGWCWLLTGWLGLGAGRRHDWKGDGRHTKWHCTVECKPRFGIAISKQISAINSPHALEKSSYSHWTWVNDTAPQAGRKRIAYTCPGTPNCQRRRKEPHSCQSIFVHITKENRLGSSI